MVNLPLLACLRYLTFREKNTLRLILVILTLWVFYNIYIVNRIKIGTLFHTTCVILMVACIGFFLCDKTLTFYILFEIRLIPTLFMVFFFGYQPEKLQASIYLLLYTVLSSLPLLLLFLRCSPYLRFVSGISSIWFGLIIRLGFMVKTPIYMVHVWLPKAHVEAPVAGSIVLAGILLKLGSYGLILFCPLFTRNILILYLSLRVWGSIYCRMICIRQWDLKRLIAYSSVVHMGVVTVGVVRGLKVGYQSAVMMVVAHGVCSPILFALAYLVYNSSHTRLISRNKGTLSTPVISFFLFLLLAINMGVPPSINLWREVLIFVSFIRIITYSRVFLIVMAFLGVVYNLFMYISLRQSKEFDFLKVDHVYWPTLSASVGAFMLFPLASWF